MLDAPHPTLRGFAPGSLPEIKGYIATTPRPQAEVVLRATGEDDPLLAVWQYGLGRAIAWTSDAGQEWAQSWPGWPEYGRYWAQLLRYTVPDPAAGPLQVRVSLEGREALLVAESVAEDGRPIDLADTTATVVGPDGTSYDVPLRQVAPGRYEQRLALPVTGPYQVRVRQAKGGQRLEAEAGFALSYPAEYGPSDGGDALLKRIAELTGGRLIARPEDVAPPRANQPAPILLWPWLLGSTLLLWPVEIALRRLRKT